MNAIKKLREALGSVGLLEKQFDVVKVTKSLEEADAIIAALQARNATLPH